MVNLPTTNSTKDAENPCSRETHQGSIEYTKHNYDMTLLAYQNKHDFSVFRGHFSESI